MAKKKKKKALKKKNVSNKSKKKVNSSKKKNTTGKRSAVNTNTSSKKGSTISKSVNTNKSNNKKNVEVNKNSTNNNTVVNKNVKIKRVKFNKKIFIVSSILLILCIVGIILLFNNINNRVSNDSFVEISFDEYLDLYEKEGLEFIYLYHSSCINCDTYEEKLNNLEKEFEINIKKFDYSKLNDSDLSILKSSNSFLEDGIEVPMILAIKDGAEVSSVSGIKEYSALKNFVSLSKSENGVNNFNKINVNEYLSILSSKEESLVYICDSSDSCSKFSSILDSVSTTRKIKVNYLNTENITSSDDWTKLESSNKIFKDMWFMPVIMVVKDNKVIGYKMEVLSESDLNKFLKKNGM